MQNGATSMTSWLAALASLLVSTLLQGCDETRRGCQLELGGAHLKRQHSNPGESLEGCPMLYVEKHDGPDECPGLPAAKTDKDDVEDPWRPLQVRAVKYVPRPVGKVGNVDLYTDSFREIHKRDLKIIATILKANTIRLDPWDNKVNHKNFLDLCKTYGLYVIPTFDLNYFFSEPKWRNAAYSDLKHIVLKHFNEYLKNVQSDSPIIMWSINYALYLNETIINGYESKWTDKMIIYAELLKGMRGVHYSQEWNKSSSIYRKDTYLRPLAIPLRLDTMQNPSDVGWYMAMFERVVWPEVSDNPPDGLEKKEPDSLYHEMNTKKEESFDALKKTGSFDVWIAETMPQTKETGAFDAISSLIMFNDSAKKDPKKGWKVIYDGGCAERACKPPPTQKASILQYGFSALVEKPGKFSKSEVDVDLQQKYLKLVWQAVDEKKYNKFNDVAPSEKNAFRLSASADLEGSCVSGAVIDEWVDDWDRCSAMGYDTQGYIQNRGGVCDEMKPGHLVHVEWFGLNSQYSFSGTHCIEMRYDGESQLSDQTAEEAKKEKNTFGFRFERDAQRDQAFNDEEDKIWQEIPRCRIVMPKFYKLFEIVVSCILVIAMWCFTCICQRRQSDENEEEDGRPSLRQSSSLGSVGTVSGSGTSLPSMGSKELHDLGRKETEEKNAMEESSMNIPVTTQVIGKTQVHVPPILREIYGEEASPHFHIHLEAKSTSGMNRISQNQVRAHLDCHVRTQELRLFHQLEAEARVVQAIEGADRNKCFPVAMAYIHARVCEGYISWLEKCDKDKAASFVGEYQGLPERPWQLWTEALLLRVIESLGEMAIHAPEFVAAFYHDVRFRLPAGESDGDTTPAHGAVLAREPTFRINYNVLHNPVEKLGEQSNPYKGGVNFDDMNDTGYFGREATMWAKQESRTVPQSVGAWKKTFWESRSLAVILDILSNFQPVFTFKFWLLLLAWYIHLGSDPRNCGARGEENCYKPQDWFNPPKFERARFIQVSFCGEAMLSFFAELLIFGHGIMQNRFHWIGKRVWLIRRVVLLIVTGLGSIGIYLHLHLVVLNHDARIEDLLQPYDDKTQMALMVCGGYMLVRVISYIILTRLKSWTTGGVPFLSGRPSNQKVRKYVYRTGHQGAHNATNRPSNQTLRSTGRAMSDPLLPETQQDDDNSVGADSVDSSGSNAAKETQRRKNTKKQLLIKLAWTIMLSITIALEVKLICPLAAGLDWDDFCGSRCKQRKVLKGSILSSILSATFWGSDCIACTSALGMAYTLVLLTGIFDIYYVFYLGTAIMGYMMGEQRGLRDVVSTTHAHVDLETSASFKDSRQRDNRDNMTHGEAMQSVFGAAWRMVWSRMVEALYDDCLITDEDAESMTKAAATVRWIRKDEAKCKNAYAATDDKFTMLKFKSLKPRSERQGVAKRGRCISELRVWVRDERKDECRLFNEEAYEEWFKDPTVVVGLSSVEDIDRVIEAVDESNILRKHLEMDGTTVKAGYKLISGESITGFDAMELRMDLEHLKSAGNIAWAGYKVVFQDPNTKFEEVCVKLDRPEHVYAVSFSTGNANVLDAFDPVRFEVHGLLEASSSDGRDIWKQIVWQETDFPHIPSQRKVALNKWFTVEFWRNTGGKAQVLELRPYCAEAKERLVFFTRSLKHMIQSKKYSVRPQQRLLECKIGMIEPLSQIIPVYSETVILQLSFLRDTDGVNTNLGFMCSQFPDEWDNFCLKHRPLLGHIIGREVTVDEVTETMYRACLDYDDKALEGSVRSKAKFLMMEIRMWASMRSQTVSRTVMGAIQYHEVLATTPCVEFADDVPTAMEHCVELVLAHQTYGSKACAEADENDVRYLLQKYRNYPFFLVFDYDAGKAKKAIEDKVVRFMKQYHNYEGRVKFASVRARYRRDSELVNFNGQMYPYHTEYSLKFLPMSTLQTLARQLIEVLGPKNAGFATSPELLNHWELITTIAEAHKIHFAPLLEKKKPSDSLLADATEECIEIIEVLPKRFPLRLGSHGFETQGKAGNQLGALRFARGHYLQMMDANMGAFLGEAAKVPFILRRFQPHDTNRCLVQARILGFREAIFTGTHGEVGKIMASAEWSFGTICQRFLAGLGMRMHYGHPDFLDGFWASNRGSLSKASPSINLSEDIFAGFNVSMRGESSKHVDALSWEKGREASFNAAALFFTKVSKGNVGVMRSRDIKLITENLNIVDNFSFYFASIGFYLNNLLIDFSVKVYVYLFVLLTLASKSLEDVGALGSMLGTEWLCSLGIVAMAPRFMELILEYGPLAGIIKFVPSIPSCMIMFTFINKSIASGISETMMTGEAAYIATGRPNANTHYSWRECYFIHCKSHFYPALKVIICYALYKLLAAEYNTSSLPMFVLLGSCVLWIIAPIMFCPQPTLGSLSKDLNEFWQFVIASPEFKPDFTGLKSTESLLHTGLKDHRSNLYEFWLADELQSKKMIRRSRFIVFATDIFKFVAVVLVCYSSMLDTIWNMFVLLAIHCLLMELWRYFDKPAFLMIVSLLMWIFVPPIIWPTEGYVNFLSTFIVLVLFLEVLSDIIKFYLMVCICPDFNWAEMKSTNHEERHAKMEACKKVQRYDRTVQWLYESFLKHLLHLYFALAVLFFFLATQFVCVALDKLCGLHSTFLLNPRLLSTGCCARREGYVPRRETNARDNVFGKIGKAVSGSFARSSFSREGSFRPSSFFRTGSTPVPEGGTSSLRETRETNGRSTETRGSLELVEADKRLETRTFS